MTDETLLDHERSVRERYAAAAQAPEAALCCPTSYDPQFLKILPEEIIEKDYGCGDPSQFVRVGETVVDLGSGAGKICYILSQKVGPTGAVIGVDVNDDMLALARKYQAEMATKIGHDNVTFKKARIQDMALDLDAMAVWLAKNPVADLDGMRALEAEQQRLRRSAPAVADDSVDVIVSNCVLNLVKPDDKAQLFADMFRVLKRGGRCVISDIVCDEEPTEQIKNDAELWSGCIAGAFGEAEFLRRFEEAGFYGVQILERQQEPWQVVDGIEFRSLTVQAWKGKQGVCLERNQAVVYRGPWRSVKDDDGHEYLRGERMAVCDKTFQILMHATGPYAGMFDGIEPLVEVPLADAGLFACNVDGLRDPRVTKGALYRKTDRIGKGEPKAADCSGPSCC
jgi:arsenite methyltransferase